MVGGELNDADVALLQTPLDLGIERREILNWDGSQLPPTNALVNLAPTVILAGTPLQQVHMQFSLLGIEQVTIYRRGVLRWRRTPRTPTPAPAPTHTSTRPHIQNSPTT